MAVFYEDHGPDFDFYYHPSPVGGNMAGMHIHPHYEVALTLEPVHSVHYVNNVKVELDTAFLTICAPFCLHKSLHEIGAETERTAFHFGDKMIEEFAPAFECIKKYQNVQAVFFPISREIAGKIEPIFRIFIKKHPRSIEQKLMFLAILNTVIHSVNEDEIIHTGGTTSYIHDVICHINQHYNEPLTVENIAQTFFISRSKLTSDFKSYTGTTIHQLLNEIRINRAVYIFHYEKWSSIQEVAERIGMGDSSQFYIVFKKATGESPLRYVKSRPYLARNMQK